MTVSFIFTPPSSRTAKNHRNNTFLHLVDLMHQMKNISNVNGNFRQPNFYLHSLQCDVLLHASCLTDCFQWSIYVGSFSHNRCVWALQLYIALPVLLLNQQHQSLLKSWMPSWALSHPLDFSNSMQICIPVNGLILTLGGGVAVVIDRYFYKLKWGPLHSSALPWILH